MAHVARGGLGLALTLALLAPLAAGIVLTLAAASESPLESAAEAEPLIGSVERAERSQGVSVSVTVEFADALSPVTNASGVLTALALTPGSEVDTGTVVGSVNHQDLVAYSSASPLSQDVSRGLKGADVVTAQHLLDQLGFYAGAADGDAGPGVERAIKAFNAAHGRGATDGTLHLASLVWVGTAGVTVGEVTATLGIQVAPGTALFTTPAALAAIKVTEPYNLPTEGDVTLTVNGVTVPYVVGSGAVTEPDAVAAIAATMTDTPEGVGTVALATPQVVGTVPASAVVTDPTGATCVFPDLTGAAVAVTPLSGTLGTVELDESMVGHSVLINPRDVREDLACA